MTDYRIGDFAKAYDLLDRGVDRIDSVDGQVRFVFSLFHCDDPKRNDEGRDYNLHATFAARDVRVVAGSLHQPFEHADGEILQSEAGETSLRLGISWRDYRTQETSWCELELTGMARNVTELVTKRA